MPDRVQPIPAPLLDLGNQQRARADYLDAIKASMDAHPRSQQTAIGPSEVGIECDRRIGYKLLGYTEPDRPNLKAQIGTWGHAGLEDVFDTYNLTHSEFAGQERYLIENTVVIGEVPYLPYRLAGHCDLYDRVTGCVLDHKFVGPSQLRHYRKDGPSQQYRIQANLYGLAWTKHGFPVASVAIAFFPRQGEFDDIYVWQEQFDQHLAEQAIARLGGIAQVTGMLGLAGLQLLPTAEAWCQYCPFFKPGSTAIDEGCPGHPGAVAVTPPPSALTLV